MGLGVGLGLAIEMGLSSVSRLRNGATMSPKVAKVKSLNSLGVGWVTGIDAFSPLQVSQIGCQELKHLLQIGLVWKQPTIAACALSFSCLSYRRPAYDGSWISAFISRLFQKLLGANPAKQRCNT